MSPVTEPAGRAGRTTTAVVPVETRHGTAAAHVHRAAGARGTVVLGHGAGGGVGAPDLVAATAAATGAGWDVVLVEQPYRVAGRRAPPRAPVLDVAWADVVAHLCRELVVPGPVVVGGRSSGARVACRTAGDTGAVGVLCLAFPLRPPSRSGAAERPSRLPELEAVGVPVLVVQGDRDPFGVPPDAPGRRVVRLSGDHALRRDHPLLAGAVTAWLGEVLPGRSPARRTPGRPG